MKNLNLSESKFTQSSLTLDEKKFIKGGDDKRGGFPTPPGGTKPPGGITHNLYCTWGS